MSELYFAGLEQDVDDWSPLITQGIATNISNSLEALSGPEISTAGQEVLERYPFLTETDIEALCFHHLDGLTPGFQKLEMFKRLAKLGGLDTVEIVPVRFSPEDGKTVQVLLARRPADDPFWPNLLHIAGSVIREDDEITHLHDWDPAISRAMREMGDVEFVNDPVKSDVVHRRGSRSREVTIRYWVEVKGEAGNQGEWHDIASVAQHAQELGITFPDHAEFMQYSADQFQLQNRFD